MIDGGDDTPAVDVVLDAPDDTAQDAARDDGTETDAGDRTDGAADAIVDASVERPDTAVDAGVDALVDRPDTAVDTGVDAVVDRPDAAVDTGVDAVVDRPDAAVDTGVDAVVDRTDTGVDAVVDRPDTAVDTGVDAVVDRPDAAVDAGPDVTMDTGVDASIDRPDATLDATVDVALDTAADRPDTAVDTGLDATVDVALDTAADRPDTAVEAAVDVPGDGAVPADPIAYAGVLSVQTNGAIFRNTITVNGTARAVWVRMPTTLRANPALVIAYHGTNGSGDGMLSEAGTDRVTATDNVIFVAPTAREWPDTASDFDHGRGAWLTYWETGNNPSTTTNQDVLLTRAIIQEARRAYGIDPRRVYAIGHSNGAFMAYMVAQLLRDRIVGFAENSGGISCLNPQQSCRFQGAGTTCSALATQPGWCTCAVPDLPMPLPSTGRCPPALMQHGTADPLVSVFHTCRLEAVLRARGDCAYRTTIYDGGGHFMPPSFATNAWTYLSAFTLP